MIPFGYYDRKGDGLTQRLISRYTGDGGIKMSADSSLSRDSEAFIQHQIAVGIYRDRNDAIEAGVELLRQQHSLLDKLDEGRRQLDQGEYVEFDREGLRQFFDGLKKRARRHAEGA
jgi:Arc/MetJ-type ribon-helix-helix transcriptional regulator